MKATSAARTGRTGEDAAAAYLVARGYDVRARNVRLGRDEIDLVAWDPVDDVLVFAEVKTRARVTAYAPELSLTARKRACMARAARRWVSERGHAGGYRLDLLCVAGGRVTAHWRELEWPSS